jgi:ABC-type sugar transport system substrate-binding protein
METTMKTLITSALAALLLAGTMAAPASAAQSEISKILFGTIYDDNVSVVNVTNHTYGREKDLPLTVIYPSRERVETAQAQVRNSPALRDAMQKRNIRIKNVIWVQTALNGGKIVYIK